MRVLTLATEFPPAYGYGLGRYVAQHTAALASAGAEVAVACNNYDGSNERYDREGVEVSNAPIFIPFKGYTWIADVLQSNVLLLARAMEMAGRNGDFDILHLHDWLAASAARSLMDAYDWPLVVSIHDTALGKNQGRLDGDEHYVAQMEGWICEHAEAVLASSESIRQELIQAYRVPPDKITVVGCGVNPQSFETRSDPQLFKSVLCRADQPLVAFVGRLARMKGPHVLLEAVPRVLSLRPQTQFVFAGGGQMREGLENRTRELGVEGSVRFVGHLRGQVLATFYRAADLVVVPSLYEPFGMVALEAAVCGTPVLVSDTGGLSEIVVDRVTGIKAPPNDPDALARGILHLLHDPDAGRELAEQARARARGQYRWEEVATRTMSVYERLVS